MIADLARMRRDLQPLRCGDDIAVELRILTGRPTDLVADRTRAINRVRARLGYFSALERAFDYSNRKAALILLTGYQTPDALRYAGAVRLAAWLSKRKAAMFCRRGRGRGDGGARGDLTRTAAALSQPQHGALSAFPHPRTHRWRVWHRSHALAFRRRKCG